MPESLQIGQVRLGAGAGLPISGDLEGAPMERNLFVDLGLSKTLDLRLQLSGYGNLGANADDRYVGVGLSAELKFSNQSGSAALLLGLNSMFYFDLGPSVDCEDDHGNWCFDGDKIMLFSASVGGVLGFGKPGDVRLLVTPKLATMFSRHQGSLSVGLDVPLGESLSLRPEATIACSILTDDGSLGTTCATGLGAALVF